MCTYSRYWQVRASAAEDNQFFPQADSTSQVGRHSGDVVDDAGGNKNRISLIIFMLTDSLTK